MSSERAVHEERKALDEVVATALRTPGYGRLRPGVVKEVLHYDMLFALHRAKLLDGLVFQGGTALRLVHGSQRLSEDLDFVGGRDFDGSGLERIKDALERFVGDRYGLDVRVKEPSVRNVSSRSGEVAVSRWTLSVNTEPARPDMPRQRIRFEVANVPAYTGDPMPLRRNYRGLADGYGGVDSFLVVTETPVEIASDKVKSLISSFPDRPRYRDVWDLGWIARQHVAPDPALVASKVRDYGVRDFDARRDDLLSRLGELVGGKTFRDEMSRFLPEPEIDGTFGREGFLRVLERDVRAQIERGTGEGTVAP